MRPGRLSSESVVAALAVAAATNLGVGFALALRQPSRAADLATMYDWCGAWLRDGQHLYSVAGASTDYPPNAIVLFSPIALVPFAWLVPLWATVTLVLTPALAYVAVRAIRPDWDWSRALPPVLLFMCWAGTRTLLEFSRLSLALAFIAVLLADSRRVASGVFLGLALAKPQIAGPIALWAIATKRFRMVAVAATVVLIGIGVYFVRTHADPVVEIRGYWRVLIEIYGDAGVLTGWTSVRPWAHALTATPAAGDRLWMLAAAILLVVPCTIAARNRGPLAAGTAGAALSAFCLWSLLTFYHIGNNLILMLPAFLLLWPRWPAAVVTTVLIADVPFSLLGHTARLSEQFGDLYRVTVIVAFASVVFWSRRSSS
jgi:hypothetical protein